MIKKIFFAAVLLVCAQAVMAENVLYAQVEGANMTLKYGEMPDDSGGIKYYKFDGTAGWNALFCGAITTATVDASCANFNGNSTKALFNGSNALTAINDIGNLNTANVEDMYSMFAECSSLTTLDLRSMLEYSKCDEYEADVSRLFRTYPAQPLFMEHRKGDIYDKYVPRML